MLASTRACGNSICTGIKVNFNWAETINYFCIEKFMSNDIECININKVLIQVCTLKDNKKITKRV